MFQRLTDRLTGTLKKLSGGGGLTPDQVDDALKEIRRSLLEADVHFKVAKDLCESVRTRAVGADVWKSLQPGHQVVQLFKEELVAALGGNEQKPPEFNGKPPVYVLIAGLQGSGKTTFCAKLALYLRKKLKKSVGLVPADCARPAAKMQLQTLGAQIDVPVFNSPIERGALAVSREAKAWAATQFFDVVIVDTAGRQQVEESLMTEISELEKELEPQEKFLVLDAMIGSQGLEVAKTFNERLGLTGLILAKLDGDTRGGAALSARQVSGVPIHFIGTGEKPADLEPFFPERMASRILGMGDVLSLIEKAQESMEHIPQEEMAENAGKLMSGRFTLEDFRDQMKMVRSMGPLEGLMKMIPGMSQAMDKAPGVDPERELKRVDAIISSMTAKERRNHDLLNGSRKARIAQGSGTTVAEINRFLKQFMEMQKMMKQMSKMGIFGKGKMMAKMAKMGRGGGFPGGGGFPF